MKGQDKRKINIVELPHINSSTKHIVIEKNSKVTG